MGRAPVFLFWTRLPRLKLRLEDFLLSRLRRIAIFLFWYVVLFYLLLGHER